MYETPLAGLILTGGGARAAYQMGVLRALARMRRECGADLTRHPFGVIVGTSAGAITALNVGYGPEDVGNSGNPGFASTVRASVSLSGARILTTPNPGEAAALLFHGTADSLVPYQWALDTVAEAEAADLQAYLTTFEGAGHVPYTQNRTTILDQTTNFLYWTLDLTNAAR